MVMRVILGYLLHAVLVATSYDTSYISYLSHRSIITLSSRASISRREVMLSWINLPFIDSGRKSSIINLCLWAQAPFRLGFPKLKTSTQKILLL